MLLVVLSFAMSKSFYVFTAISLWARANWYYVDGSYIELGGRCVQARKPSQTGRAGTARWLFGELASRSCFPFSFPARVINATVAK